MPALSSIQGMQARVPDASATVVQMPALSPATAAAHADPVPAPAAKGAGAFNPMVIVVILVIVGVIVAAVLYLAR